MAEVVWSGTVEADVSLALEVEIRGYATIAGDKPTAAEIGAAKDDAIAGIKQEADAMFGTLMSKVFLIDNQEVTNWKILESTAKETK